MFTELNSQYIILLAAGRNIPFNKKQLEIEELKDIKPERSNNSEGQDEEKSGFRNFPGPVQARPGKEIVAFRYTVLPMYPNFKQCYYLVFLIFLILFSKFLVYLVLSMIGHMLRLKQLA